MCNDSRSDSKIPWYDLFSVWDSKGKKKVTVRHAEKPGETVNVDIGFVPIKHEAVEEIPAVSGSSGKLKVSKTKSEKQENEWPGEVFNKPEATYEQAMDAYIDARAQKDSCNKKTKHEQGSIKARKEELLEQEQTLRQERRSIREKRKMEDESWRNLKKQRRDEKVALKEVSRQERRAKRAEQQAKEEIWRQKRIARREQRQCRKEQERIWRENRRQIRLDLYNLPIGAFVAILVIIDNCTRQCLGLPIFVAGKHVTAQMVVDALAVLLPPHLQYLIADRGIHFKAKVLLELAHLREFKRVLLSPHRPQSNGIAERFVRTVKEYLTACSWENPEQLEPILKNLPFEYNERPHQGLELQGLSPNEYARRIAFANAG